MIMTTMTNDDIDDGRQPRLGVPKVWTLTAYSTNRYRQPGGPAQSLSDTSTILVLPLLPLLVHLPLSLSLSLSLASCL